MYKVVNLTNTTLGLHQRHEKWYAEKVKKKDIDSDSINYILLQNKILFFILKVTTS